MAQINFDLRVFESLDRAKTNPDAAAQAIVLAAEYIRAGKPLPKELAEHIAGAFENAMSAPREKRGHVLLQKLHLKHGNRPPKDLDWYEIGQDVDMLVQKGLSQFDAATEICVDLQETMGVKLSESTVLRLWRDVYRPAREAHDKASLD